MEQIIIDASVENKLYSLAEALYYKEYFSYWENVEDYVNNIVDFIYTIPNQPRRRTKHPKLGKYYCRYKANAQTSYYITFDVVEDFYFIKNIISNHTKEYPIYIKGL